MEQSHKSDFPIFKKYPELAYFDNAATSQKPALVIDRISKFYSEENSNIHRGVYDLSNEASQNYERVRADIARFIGAPGLNNIAFTKGTTEGVNIVANSMSKNFQKGQNIIISLMEHHANFIPWQQLALKNGLELRVIPVNSNGELDYSELKSMIDSNTAFIAISHISNTLGTINDISRITTEANKFQIPVLLDAAQSAGLYDLDVKELGVDFLVFSAHKMFGPFGIGALYVSDKYRDDISPYNLGGGIIETVKVEGTDFRSFPHNLDAGTPNVAGVIGFGAAIEYLTSLDRKIQRNRLNELRINTEDKLRAIPEVKILGEAAKKSFIISFGINGIHPHDIASFLNQDNIAVRAGMHCTQPLLEGMDFGPSVRASFSIYNELEESERFIHSIKELINFWK